MEPCWSRTPGTSKKWSGQRDRCTWSCNFPRPVRTCSGGYSKRRMCQRQRGSARALCSWDLRRHASARTPRETPFLMSGCSPRQCCHSHRRRARAPGSRSPAHQQILLAERLHRWPGLRTKTLRTGTSLTSWRRYRKRCCRRERRHTSSVAPRLRVICRPEPVEWPGSSVMSHSAIGTSDSTGCFEPAKSWLYCRTT